MNFSKSKRLPVMLGGGVALIIAALVFNAVTQKGASHSAGKLSPAPAVPTSPSITPPVASEALSKARALAGHPPNTTPSASTAANAGQGAATGTTGGAGAVTGTGASGFASLLPHHATDNNGEVVLPTYEAPLPAKPTVASFPGSGPVTVPDPFQTP